MLGICGLYTKSQIALIVFWSSYSYFGPSIQKIGKLVIVRQIKEQTDTFCHPLILLKAVSVKHASF